LQFGDKPPPLGTCSGSHLGGTGYKKLLFRQLDSVPRRVAEHHIEASGAIAIERGKSQVGVQEAIGLGALPYHSPLSRTQTAGL